MPITATENTERSKGTIINQGDSEMVGDGDGELELTELTGIVMVCVLLQSLEEPVIIHCSGAPAQVQTYVDSLPLPALESQPDLPLADSHQLEQVF